MSLLSADLKQLHDRFNAWISGSGAPFTMLDAIAFRRALKLAEAKAHLVEMGIDGRLFDEAVFGPSLPPNVIAFPKLRIVRDAPNDGSVA